MDAATSGRGLVKGYCSGDSRHYMLQQRLSLLLLQRRSPSLQVAAASTVAGNGSSANAANATQRFALL
ncbi:Hypothetical predicted protein [Olea europaea subsp. europaea]|uniref:Uncharacterized protein n=1 Tax=Olea europaea subsp. europaea TaxID=158383 RepID=A0A8S0R5M0_OLEEU|nr:Hypothetical predicted protein [Olea europaea subsp. europaea]